MIQFATTPSGLLTGALTKIKDMLPNHDHPAVHIMCTDK
jgi:hypothetical protein